MPDPQNPTGTATPAQTPPPDSSGVDLSGIRFRTLQQAKSELPQPKITPPWEEEPELNLPPTTKLGAAYEHAKQFLETHEKTLSEKYLAPFRTGLDAMASDLESAASSGHTKSGGQLNPVTRGLVGATGAALRAVPIGSNVKETAQALITPPEFPEGRGLSRELKATEKVAAESAPNLEGIRYKVVSPAKDVPKPSQYEAVGIHSDDLPSRAKYQDVDFSAQDLQDSAKKVTPETIRKDYAGGKKDVSVYQAHIPMQDLPSAKFVEPEEENFDRGEYSRPRVGVPIKVAVNKDGSLEILDGNHRVQTWEEQGQEYAPAWVVDRRGPGIEKLSEDEISERAEIEEEERQAAKESRSQTEQPSIYTPEGAQPLAEKLGAKVVGSVTKKESERVPNAYGSTKPRDLDLRIEGEYKQDEILPKLKAEGFEPVGSSVVSPEEIKQSGKPYGKPGWKRAEHFENAATGEKLDFWHDEAEKPWAIHDLGKEHNIPSEEGYLYHATNHDRARDIAESGLDTHKPSYGTDQEAWPDGSTDKRSYFTKQADHAWQFSPEEGKPALLRMKQDPAIHSRESTGDFYSKKKIPANKIEVLGDDKQWHPVSELAESKATPKTEPKVPLHEKLFSEALKGQEKTPAKTATRTTLNASGESAASQEAINRASSEKATGTKRVRIDTRSGAETPIIGSDAVDAKASPYDVIVQRTPGKPEVLLDSGARARPYRPKR